MKKEQRKTRDQVSYIVLCIQLGFSIVCIDGSHLHVLFQFSDWPSSVIEHLTAHDSL